MISDFAVSFALLEQYISFVVFFPPQVSNIFVGPWKTCRL